MQGLRFVEANPRQHILTITKTNNFMLRTLHHFLLMKDPKHGTYSTRMIYDLIMLQVTDANTGAELLRGFLRKYLEMQQANPRSFSELLEAALIRKLLAEMDKTREGTTMQKLIAGLSNKNLITLAKPQTVLTEALNQFFTYFSEHLHHLPFELCLCLFPDNFESQASHKVHAVELDKEDLIDKYLYLLQSTVPDSALLNQALSIFINYTDTLSQHFAYEGLATIASCDKPSDSTIENDQIRREKIIKMFLQKSLESGIYAHCIHLLAPVLTKEEEILFLEKIRSFSTKPGSPAADHYRIADIHRALEIIRNAILTKMQRLQAVYQHAPLPGPLCRVVSSYVV